MVTIDGTNFGGATVSMSGRAVTAVVYTSAIVVTLYTNNPNAPGTLYADHAETIPVSGKITVTTPGGTATSTGSLPIVLSITNPKGNWYQPGTPGMFFDFEYVSGLNNSPISGSSNTVGTNLTPVWSVKNGTITPMSNLTSTYTPPQTIPQGPQVVANNITLPNYTQQDTLTLNLNATNVYTL